MSTPPIILIVDDDSSHRAMLRTVLRGWGYATDEADDGDTAVEKVKERAYDAVLSDVRMARMDGISAIREILHHNPSIPVLVMTAWQSVETAVAGFESEVIGRVEAETQRLGGEASTAVSTAKDQAMTALDAHMEQKTEGLDLHAADLKAALTASLGTREEEAIGAVRIERDAALVVLREEGAQFREDLNTLAERSEDAAKRAACSAAITVKAASDVDEALTDTALDLLAPQVVAEAGLLYTSPSPRDA